jgi:hypothetical protein
MPSRPNGHPAHTLRLIDLDGREIYERTKVGRS